MWTFWGIYIYFLDYFWFGQSSPTWRNILKMGKSEVPDLLSTPNGGRKNLPLKKVTKQNTTKTVTRFKNLVVEDSGKTIETSPGGGFTYFFLCTPPTFGGKWFPFWRAYFSGGLVRSTTNMNRNKPIQQQPLKSGLHCEEACHHGEVAFVTCRRVGGRTQEGLGNR